MRIVGITATDLKDLGKNQLVGIGFALTGFIVAFSVAKACTWFFKDQMAVQTTPNQKQLRRFLYQIVVAGLGCQSCEFLAKSIGLERGGRTTSVNPKALILHIAAFALASLGDKRKIIRAGIGLSAACVVLNPMIFGIAGAALGGFSDDFGF